MDKQHDSDGRQAREDRAGGPLTAKELELTHAYWRACNYLSVGMIYLRDNPLLREAAHRRARQAPAARPLGGQPGALVRLGPPEPDDREARPRRHLRRRPGPRRAGRARAGLPRGDLLGVLSGQERRRGGDAEVLQAVLLPRRHRQPRHARDARIDPRGRRARLQPLARLRHGLRQPRPHRRLRRGRRRGRDRAARDGLALEQVPQPRARRRRAADPQPQRLQDREPQHPLPHQPRGARGAVRRLRLQAPTSSRGATRW